MTAPNIEFALEVLFREVKALFLAESTVVSDGLADKSITQTFGWKEPASLINSSPHIVWVPGDPNGSAGSIVAPRMPGQVPARSLNDFDELFFVEFHGMNRNDLEDEQLQYNAAMTLFHLWWRAVYISRSTRVSFVSASWLNDRKVRRAGATIRAICSIQCPVLDAASRPVLPGTQASITVSELDVTDPAIVVPVEE
jgi:hypothetical protein